jgi:hypothetical protein
MDDISLANILGGENEYELLNAKARVSEPPSCPRAEKTSSNFNQIMQLRSYTPAEIIKEITRSKYNQECSF